MKQENLIRGTIVCPFTDKGIINERWFNHFFHNFTLDPAEWKMILFDTSEEMVSRKYMKLLDDMKFAELRYLHVPNRFEKPHRKWFPLHLKMGTAIGHVWADTREHIEGNLVLMLEDDCLLPKYGFETLIKDMEDDPHVGMASAVQRFKPSNKSPKEMLAWIQNPNREVVTNDLFETDSVQYVSSTATGMIVTYADLYKIPDMSIMTTEYRASQDIAYCIILKRLYGLHTIIDSRVEVLHHTKGMRKAGVLKSPKTPLGNTDFSPEIIPNAGERSEYQPIFLVGLTGRSGTTWIQRIFMSHKDVMMYGEPQGALNAIETCAERLVGITYKGACSNSKEEFIKSGANGFIPNLQPEHASQKVKVRRNLMNSFYSISGKPIWGIKSIDWSPTTIIQIYRSFPKATFIFINRDLDKLKPSFEKVGKRWWNMKWSDALNRIEKMEHFLKYIPKNMHYLRINHSDWENNQTGLCDYLEKQFDFEPNSLSREVAVTKLKFNNKNNPTR